MKQLNQHLDSLPEPVMRMVLVLQECGLRIGELCQLRLDCLKQDAKGDFFLYFMRWKMKKESTIPISLELAQVIQTQQEYIQNYFGDNFNYLFSTKEVGSIEQGFKPAPRVMRQDSFVGYLKRLAKKFDIRDASGKAWEFQTHQFRHTVGTRMINNGVPQHIIQRYLGHESPRMTSVYAYIHDQTLKQEIAKYHDSRVVNVAGEVVESTTPELDNDLDLHLLKKLKTELEATKNKLSVCQVKLLESHPKLTSINQKIKQSVTDSKIDDDIKAKLSNLGIRLNSTLKKIITSSTQQEVNNAISAVEEYLNTDKKVKSKPGLLRTALEEGWTPNLTNEERQLTQVTDTFSEWFKLAKDQGIGVNEKRCGEGEFC